MALGWFLFTPSVQGPSLEQACVSVMQVLRQVHEVIQIVGIKCQVESLAVGLERFFQWSE
jgi:hypothetical protein